jgi:uncharacterized lipoprotein
MKRPILAKLLVAAAIVVGLSACKTTDGDKAKADAGAKSDGPAVVKGY